MMNDFVDIISDNKNLILELEISLLEEFIDSQNSCWLILCQSNDQLMH